MLKRRPRREHIDEFGSCHFSEPIVVFAKRCFEFCDERFQAIPVRGHKLGTQFADAIIELAGGHLTD
jgi:hypothetical protein